MTDENGTPTRRKPTAYVAYGTGAVLSISGLAALAESRFNTLSARIDANHTYVAAVDKAVAVAVARIEALEKNDVPGLPSVLATIQSEQNSRVQVLTTMADRVGAMAASLEQQTALLNEVRADVKELRERK